MNETDTQSTLSMAEDRTAAERQSDGGFWSRRLGVRALRYPIPSAALSFPYLLGALTFVSFVVLVVTGVWLAQFYNPAPAGAHDSLLYIITRAPFGDVARSLHYWAASVMVLSIVAHIAWVFVRRSYRAPREITWYAGVGLAALVFLMVVTGPMLRFDQEGYEALAHFLAGGELVGAIGAFFTSGFTPSTPVLSRIFSLHVSLVPLAMIALIALHFWLIRVLGIRADGPATARFDQHLSKIVGAGLLLLGVMLALATFAPEDLGYPPVPGHEITKPFWPVLWIYALESFFGITALLWAPLAVFLFLVLVPLIDRGGASDSRAVVTSLRSVGAILLITLLGLGLWAALSPPQQHLGM